VIFRPELSWEFLPREEITSRTLRALRNHVRHLKASSSYYSEALFDITLDDITSFDRFETLPFTAPDTLATRNDALCGVSNDEITETVIVDTDTTPQRPYPVFLTASDTDRIAFDAALGYHACGITPGDTVVVLLDTNKPDIAGLSAYMGLKLLGANVIRFTNALSRLNTAFMQRLQPSAFVGDAHSLQALIKTLRDIGMAEDAFTDKKVICAGFDIRDESMHPTILGKTLGTLFGSNVYSFQPFSMCQCGFWECSAQNGLHLHPELAYAEIVDSAGTRITDDKPGELVLTPLGLEAMPLLRVKTGITAYCLSDSCSCGRNAQRIVPFDTAPSTPVQPESQRHPVPERIAHILDSFDQIQDYVIIMESDRAHAEKISIHALISPQMVHTVYRMIHAQCNIDAPILVSNPATIQSIRGSREATDKIIDKRGGYGAS
jgi:phenylacetate-CoA ligase